MDGGRERQDRARRYGRCVRLRTGRSLLGPERDRDGRRDGDRHRSLSASARARAQPRRQDHRLHRDSGRRRSDGDDRRHWTRCRDRSGGYGSPWVCAGQRRRDREAEGGTRRRSRSCASRGNQRGAQGRPRVDPWRLWRLPRQVPARRHDGERPRDSHGADARPALLQAAARKNRQWRARYDVPDQPPPAARAGRRWLQELPRQPERMDEGRPQSLKENIKANDKTKGGVAVVTGASSGIGFALAKCAAQDGYELLIAANESEINGAADEISREHGVAVSPLQVDLAAREGVDQLVAVIGSRPVALLFA